MRLTKKQRAALHGKYGGRCAYCGCDLGERWHADHIEPVVRNDWIKRFGMESRPPTFPGRDTLENHNPACAPCNISKGSLPLEAWRTWLAGHLESLNLYTPIYRMVKKFGLIEETGKPVLFFFETWNPEHRAAAALADAGDQQ